AVALGATRLGLQEGQPSVMAGAIVILALALLVEGRDTSGGVVLGVAIAMKLFPVLLIVPLMARRRFRAVAAAAIVCVVVGLATIAALGPHDVGPALRSTRQATTVGLGTPTPHNQSIPGVILRASNST